MLRNTFSRRHNPRLSRTLFYCSLHTIFDVSLLLVELSILASGNTTIATSRVHIWRTFEIKQRILSKQKRYLFVMLCSRFQCLLLSIFIFKENFLIGYLCQQALAFMSFFQTGEVYQYLHKAIYLKSPFTTDRHFP